MTILTLEGMGRSFGGVRAVDDLSFSVEEGQLFGVIGPNGAGKTTLFNLITGLIQPDRGRVMLKGTDVTGKRPEHIATLGVARTYQTIRLFDNMSVRDNVMVGGHIGLSYSMADLLLWRSRYREAERRLRAQVEELLETVGLTRRADDPAGALSYGEQRRLELARALAARPSLLMLDEPAAGMNSREALDLSQLLRRLVGGGGLTVLLIEHNVRMMMDLCDRLAVMNFGRKLAEGEPAVLRNDPAVIEAYLGREEDEVEA